MIAWVLSSPMCGIVGIWLHSHLLTMDGNVGGAWIKLTPNIVQATSTIGENVYWIGPEVERWEFKRLPCVRMGSVHFDVDSPFRVLEYGWPMRASVTTFKIIGVMNYDVGEGANTTRRRFSLHEIGGRIRIRLPPVPLRIFSVWRVLGNGAVTAGMVLSVLLAPGAYRKVRSRWWHSKGRCARCGYSIGPLMRCPEFGSTDANPS